MARRTRKPTLYTFNCTGCGYCVKVCGNEVLKLVDNGSCRFVNVADASRCTGCGRCERRCPHGAISLKPENTKKLKTAGLVLGTGAALASGAAVIMWLWNAFIPAAGGRDMCRTHSHGRYAGPTTYKMRKTAGYCIVPSEKWGAIATELPQHVKGGISMEDRTRSGVRPDRT